MYVTNIKIEMYEMKMYDKNKNTGGRQEVL